MSSIPFFPSSLPSQNDTTYFFATSIVPATESSLLRPAPCLNNVETTGKYNEQLQKTGVVLELDGLTPPSTMSTRVTFKGGKSKVTDGPFTEAKEVVGGYWIIQVKSREEALEWASRIPRKDNQMVEVRRMFEITDFPADVQAKFVSPR